MLAGLIVAAVLPDAFGERSHGFAVTYVVLQLGRTAFVVLALRREPALRRDFERIAVWLACSGACWLAGGLVGGSRRDVLRLAAVVIDFAAPHVLAGVIVTAVADERVIAHPTGHGSAAVTALLLGGPGLFLLGHLLFKRAVFGTLSWARVAALAAAIPLGGLVSPLGLAAMSGAVVVGVVVIDLILYPGHGPVAQPE
jgi:low temperature requirement protein LtrA